MKWHILFYSILWQINSNINMNDNKYQSLVTMAPIYWSPPGKCYAVGFHYYLCHFVFTFAFIPTSIHHISSFPCRQIMTNLLPTLSLSFEPNRHNSNRNKVHDSLYHVLPHNSCLSKNLHIQHI